MIFATEAPKYWRVGLPAIPLMANGKRPAINRWQIFADTFPTQDEREVWVQQFPAGNIGLPMGPCSGLVAVDVDTEDPEILKVLDRVLPPSPWVRVGKKGSVRIYQFNGERTTRIKDASGAMICEILSKGTQFVLPPSIHPDTGRPYTANCELVDVFKSAPMLPSDFEKQLREALKSIGIEMSTGANHKIATFVPAGARDNTMVWHAGLLARAVLKGERSLVQALGEMKQWVEAFVEQVIGDPLTVEKAQSKLIEFLIKDVTNEKRKALPIGWDEGLTEEDKEKLGLSFTEDDEVWAADRILEFIQEEFERNPEFRSSGRMQAVSIALDRIARAGPAISSLEESMILRYIAAQSANVFSQADLKKQLVAIRRGDITGESHKELAEAVVEFLSEYGEIRFDAGAFWQWKGAFWQQKQEHEILKVIAEEFGNYPAARRQSDHRGILGVMKAICAEELRKHDTRGLNFANGFLNEDLELVDHSPDHGMTYVLPYRYLPELAGHMPIFNQFLHDSWSEDPDYGDKLLALQETMGATLMSVAPRYQKAVCLIGVAGSGKSQVTALMQGLLPENSVSAIPPHDWSDKFLPAQMFGKVMNFAGELSESKNIPGHSFKEIVVGETIQAQHKNQSPFQFKPTCAQWFSSNHLPKTKDFSDGFNRRWLFLEWAKRVPEHKRIPELAQIILEHEREAIVAWAVQGYARLKEQGSYTLPTSHLALVDQMAADNNSARAFLTRTARVVVGLEKTKDEIDAATLHGEYWQYCIAAGVSNRASLPAFIKLMKELEGTMHFKIIQRSTTNGHIEVIFQGIGYAEGVKP